MKSYVAKAALYAALGVMFTTITARALYARALAAQEGILDNLPWMQPPPEFKDMQRQGFHAGVQAAVKDYDKHKEPDLERHKGYVHPKVDRSYIPDYRDGFKRGYNDAYRHLTKAHGQAG